MLWQEQICSTSESELIFKIFLFVVSQWDISFSLSYARAYALEFDVNKDELRI